MLSATLLALLAAQPIVLSERSPLAFLLNTPTGEIANASNSEIIRIVSTTLEEHTSLFLQESEGHIAQDCKGRPGFIGCIVLAIRGEERKPPYPHYLLVLSNVTVQGQADRISAILVDTDLALDLYHSASRENEDWQRDTEARINETAVLAGPVRRDVKNAVEAKRFIEELITHDLAPIFDHSGHWEPYGTISLNTPRPGIGISLDGASVGTTRAGRTEIKNVTAGSRKLALEHPDYHPFAATIEVERGKTSAVEADLVRVTQAIPLIRKTVLWSGIGVGVIGAATVVLAIAKHNGDIQTTCFAVPGSGCKTGQQFETIHYDANANQVNPPGILLAPLGYSLIGTGATWSLGTYLLGDDSDFPWIPIVAGVAVGVVSYGLSAILNGSSPTAAPAR